MTTDRKRLLVAGGGPALAKDRASAESGMMCSFNVLPPDGESAAARTR